MDSVSVAGSSVLDPATTIVEYIASHPSTVEGYDGIAGTSAVLTAELIKATRRPLMGSRISRTEEHWFLERCAKAVAHLEAVPPRTVLGDVDFSPSDCDPGNDDALDAVAGLWLHFAQAAPSGISWGKISKCLYLLRPGVYPILDSRLCARYRPVARRISRRVRNVDLGKVGIAAYWAAVQQDVHNASETLARVRPEVISRSAPEFSALIGRLTDVRLLDMCTWTP